MGTQRRTSALLTISLIERSEVRDAAPARTPLGHARLDSIMTVRVLRALGAVSSGARWRRAEARTTLLSEVRDPSRLAKSGCSHFLAPLHVDELAAAGDDLLSG